jgi:hypothetical protein
LAADESNGIRELDLGGDVDGEAESAELSMLFHVPLDEPAPVAAPQPFFEPSPLPAEDLTPVLSLESEVKQAPRVDSRMAAAAIADPDLEATTFARPPSVYPVAEAPQHPVVFQPGPRAEALDPAPAAETAPVAESLPASVAAASPAPSGGRARERAEAGYADVIDRFDRYWRQGRIEHARRLLATMERVAVHEPWWQARQALVERSMAAIQELGEDRPKARPRGDRSAGGGGPAAAAARPGAPRLPLGPLPAEQFWQPIAAELGRLSARAGANGPAAGRQAQDVSPLAAAPVRDPLAAAAGAGEPPSAELLAAVEARCRQLTSGAGGAGAPTPGAPSREVWELLSALFGAADGATSAAAAALLEALRLTRADVGFWGLYLDSLIASGRSRRALVEIQAAIEAHPQLAWARCAYRRLPTVWASMGQRGFAWSEDDGVPLLRKRLSTHSLPTLAALVGSWTARPAG